MSTGTATRPLRGGPGFVRGVADQPPSVELTSGGECGQTL
jgi:hypothetical protein